MSTKIPVTLEGNVAADPEFGVSQSGKQYAQFGVITNDRIKDAEGNWSDGQSVYHRITVFNRQAENVRDSLRTGAAVIVSGDLKFISYEKNGEKREGHEVIADTVSASLKHTAVNIPERTVGGPKASGPDTNITATGPVATPVSEYVGGPSLTH